VEGFVSATGFAAVFRTNALDGEFRQDFLDRGTAQAIGSECGFDLVFGFRFFRQKRDLRTGAFFYHLALQLDISFEWRVSRAQRGKISGPESAGQRGAAALREAIPG